MHMEQERDFFVSNMFTHTPMQSRINSNNFQHGLQKSEWNKKKNKKKNKLKETH